MSKSRRLAFTVLYGAVVLALPLTAAAQTTPASSSSSASMDMGSMPGMEHGQMAMPASVPPPAKPAASKKKKSSHARKAAGSAMPMQGVPSMDHTAMPSMAHQPATSHAPAPANSMPGMEHNAMPGMNAEPMPGMDHGAMPSMHGASQGTGAMTGGAAMGPMQGGKAPPDARSPDYSNGVGYGDMQGMDMRDNAPLDMLLIDQLEAFHGKDGDGQSWEAEGWYGKDRDKLWLRTEGERSRGRIEDGDAEAFWSRHVATFWSTQLGVRHDFGAGPSRDWAAFGIQGLAPYWFELEATGYVGPSGRTAARLRAEYELLFTQKLILQPEFEVNAYGQADPARRLGSGVSDAQLGLRLRYEIRRQVAPYVGVVWTRRLGGTADFARDDHQPIFDRQWVAGIRIWF